MFSSIRGKVVLPILLMGFAFSILGSYIIYHEIKDEYVSHSDTILKLVTDSITQSFSLSNDSLDWHRDTKKMSNYSGIQAIYIIDEESLKILSAADESMIGRSIAKLYDHEIQKMIQRHFEKVKEKKSKLNNSEKSGKQIFLIIPKETEIPVKHAPMFHSI